MSSNAITIDTLKTAALEIENEILRLLTTLETSGVRVNMVYLDRIEPFGGALQNVRLEVSLCRSATHRGPRWKNYVEKAKVLRP